LEALTVNCESFKALADGKDVFIDDDYLRGATSINHQVSLRVNFKMYPRSAKGGEKGDPNRNPWLAKMLYLVHVKVSKLWQTGKMFSLEPKREVANGCHMRAFRCHRCLHFVDNMCSV
jgi:hypothetical protein